MNCIYCFQPLEDGYCTHCGGPNPVAKAEFDKNKAKLNNAQALRNLIASGIISTEAARRELGLYDIITKQMNVLI